MRKKILLSLCLLTLLLFCLYIKPVSSQPIILSEPTRALWIETSANLPSLKDRKSIEQFLDKVAMAGFNTIIPEAKNAFGYVLYQSKIAPKINDLNVARTWYPQYPAPNTFLDPNFDILATLVEEAHKRNIKVITAVNIFSEGLNSAKIGSAFIHREWQSALYIGQRMIYGPTNIPFKISGVNIPRGDNQLIIYTPDRHRISPASKYGVEIGIKDNIVSAINDRQTLETDSGPSIISENGFLISAKGTAREWALKNLKLGDKVVISEFKTTITPSSEQGSLIFVNPAHPEVIKYELAILEELTKNYNIDGIILDRARYENIFSDFSFLSQISFELQIGQSIKNWPEDIISLKPTKFWFEFERGPLFNQWVSWRAKTIQMFMAKAQNRVKQIKPHIIFMNYVAGWYPDYWNEGVNWAAKGYKPGYDWTNNEWPETGVAHLFDYLIVGTYYRNIAEEDALINNLSYWQSIEGSINLANKITSSQTKIIPGISINLYKDNFSADLAKIIRIIKNTDANNIMIFDATFIEQYNWWSEIKKIWNEQN